LDAKTKTSGEFLGASPPSSPLTWPKHKISHLCHNGQNEGYVDLSSIIVNICIAHKIGILPHQEDHRQYKFSQQNTNNFSTLAAKIN
jgi:hypothetical protein